MNPTTRYVGLGQSQLAHVSEMEQVEHITSEDADRAIFRGRLVDRVAALEVHRAGCGKRCSGTRCR